jgi:cell division transport system ATP-binding protein
LDKDTLVSFDNVGLRYNSTKETLRDISLDIKRGDFIFIIGNSGAGKTSLLNLIHASLKPSRGFLNIFGQDVSSMNHKDLSNVRRRIGFVFQDFRLINELSVFDNVALPLKIIGLSNEEISFRVNAMLEWVDMINYKNHFPQNLSGGQQQKVSVARAVINNPDIILADEPTGSIDTKMTDKIISLFEELNKNGVSIIFSTHNEYIIKNTNHKILLVENSKVDFIKDCVL